MAEDELGSECSLGPRIPLHIHSSSSKDLQRSLFRRATLISRTDSSPRDNGSGWLVFAARLAQLEDASERGCPVTAENCDFDLEEFLKDAAVGKYKDRHIDGRLLHHALWHDFMNHAEAAATKIVLEAGARVDSVFISRAPKRLELQAIHLAAGLGYVPGLELLLEFKADIGAMTLRDGERHYAAIHDAVYLQQATTVQMLVKHAADPSVYHGDGMSVFHLAAWAGSADLLHLLVAAPKFEPEILLRRASLRLSADGRFGKRSMTPLGLAAFTATFSGDQLLIMAPFYYGKGSFFAEIRELVHINPKKALQFMDGIENAPAETRSELATWIVQEALRGNGKYCNSMTTRFSEQTLVNCLADIIYQAPLVALKILHILTVKPYIADTVALKHPMPQSSSMKSFDPITRLLGHRESVQTAYEGDYCLAEHCFIKISEYHYDCARANGMLGLPEWKMNSEDEEFPAWHWEFMEMNRMNTERLHNPAIKCMVVCVPSILDVRVVHAINATHFLGMFSHPSVIGIGHELWKLAFRVFYLDCLMEIAVTVSLTDRAVRLQEGDARVQEVRPNLMYDRLCLSLMLGELLRNFFRLIHFMVMHKGHYKFKRGLMSSKIGPVPKIFGDLLRLLLMFAYVHLAIQRHGRISWDTDDDRQVGKWDQLFLCMNCFLHSVKNLNMLCYVSVVGPKMNALLESLAPMGSMLFVGAGLWSAFLVPLLSLRGKASGWQVAKSLFSSMARADTNVLPFLEGLDEGSMIGEVACEFIMGLVAVMFTICYMNLLIGMYGSVYAARESKSHLLFARARFHMAERYLLEPVWNLTGDSWFTRQSTAECGAHGWTLLPFLLSALCFALWLLAVYLVLPLEAAGLLFAASLLLLQAGMMQNWKFNNDIDMNGLHVFDEDGADDYADCEDSDVAPNELTLVSVDSITPPTTPRSDAKRNLLKKNTDDLQFDNPANVRRCLWIVQRKNNHQATDEEDRLENVSMGLFERLDLLSGQIAELQKRIPDEITRTSSRTSRAM